MQALVYTRPDGGTSICRPALQARLVKSVVAGGKRVVFDPPVRMDSIERETAKIAGWQPEWAETDEEFMARIRAKSVPKDATNVSIREVPDNPEEKPLGLYRNALRHDFTPDMAKCREIHRNLMRATRGPLLEALDLAYMRADEAGDAAAKAAIAARKRALRDVTADPAIEAAKTLDELKAVWPEALGVRG